MNSFFPVLSFLVSLVLAGAVVLVVPDVTGWRESGAVVLAVAILVGFGLGQSYLARRRILRRLSGVERNLSHIHHRTERLADRLSAVYDSGLEGGQPEDMIREMRVLQTLLGQIVGRSGGDRRLRGDAVSASDILMGLEVTKKARETLSPEMEDDILSIVQSALSENRVDLYLQPTVALPSRRPLYYECFSRVRGERDEVIYPRQYLSIAESSGLVGTLDNLLLFRCIQLVRKLGPRRPNVRFFCNISLASVMDEEFFPQFVDYMVANQELASRLVFEFAQEDLMGLGREMHDRLFALGRSGYSFGMDQLQSLDLDPAQLKSWHVHFVKADVETILAADNAQSPRSLRSALKRQGIDLIATKVEDEAQVLELLDLDVAFAQGYLFGEPRLSRGTISGEAE